MNIVADENIPLLDELFQPMGNVVRRSGRAISAADLHDTEILLVRSVTKVNEDLLKHSPVRFVGSCTIGTDHLDTEYLQASGITYASAPGCNAWGVVQYVFAAMAALDLLDRSQTVGIIGCGNVGGRLYRALKAMNYECVCYDPFLSSDEIPDLAAWERLYDCDLICAHTPLTTSGPHPTWHMLDTEFFSNLKKNAVLLNAGRGGVINNASLLNYLKQKNSNHIHVVLDVWENEPAVNTALLDRCSIATPHIAGYSYEGKINGSFMIYQALRDFLRLSPAATHTALDAVKKAVLGEQEALNAESLKQAIIRCYDIRHDDGDMRAASEGIVDQFDALRKNYPVRREFSHYWVSDTNPANETSLKALGFSLERDPV